MTMRLDAFVYLSGPITATPERSIEQHVASAVDVYWQLLRRGVPAFCPHLSAAFPTAFLIPYEEWMAYDLIVIGRCTHVLMLPGWETSRGAARERTYAQEIGIPVFDTLAELERTL